MTTLAKASIFIAKKENYTTKQWDRIQQQKRSEEQAHRRLTALYGTRVANTVIYNVTMCYYNIKRKFADTYEQACDSLGDDMLENIIYRAVNNLPSIGAERKPNQSLSDFWGQFSTREVTE
ncbi:TPA: hypothetical protein TYI97_001589 [Streptococcus suis]|uniref:hypothetical protein n=1 Tax=Streptococcus TaxID=1301 RepID=UPI002A799597|nr:hypothetical protein [Streptococcus suis]HEM3590867.1 hypothetical protein [Streptococcus suis]HEP1834080.1 hypothetical protein [Streptococcus suis]